MQRASAVVSRAPCLPHDIITACNARLAPCSMTMTMTMATAATAATTTTTPWPRARQVARRRSEAKRPAAVRRQPRLQRPSALPNGCPKVTRPTSPVLSLPRPSAALPSDLPSCGLSGSHGSVGLPWPLMAAGEVCQASLSSGELRRASVSPCACPALLEPAPRPLNRHGPALQLSWPRVAHALLLAMGEYGA